MNRLALEKHNKKATDRTKFLNVIYFVDSQRTHAFKISISSSILALLSLCFIVFWSLISTALLINQAIDSQRKSEKIQSLLSTIFAYETKHDLVYEKTYPKRYEGWASEGEQEVNTDLDQAILKNTKEKPDITLAAKNTESNANNVERAGSSGSSNQTHANPTKPTDNTPKVEQKSQNAAVASHSNPKISSVMEDPIHQEDEATNTQIETNKNQNPKNGVSDTQPIDPPPITIEQMEIETSKDSVEFKFALKNLDSPNLTAGSVIGIATFIDDKGNIKEVLAPPGIEFDKDVPRTSLPVNHRYSIRYYKKKVLVFKKPQEFDGWIQKIRLIIRDPEGNSREIMYNPPEDKIKGHKEVSR